MEIVVATAQQRAVLDGTPACRVPVRALRPGGKGRIQHFQLHHHGHGRGGNVDLIDGHCKANDAHEATHQSALPR